MRTTRMCILLFAVLLYAITACTNMNKVQQGALSGLVVGGAAGLGIGAIAGGSGTVGAILGGALGSIAGGIYGKEKTKAKNK